MNVQKDYAGDSVEYDETPPGIIATQDEIEAVRHAIDDLLQKARRPLVLMGAGLGLTGTAAAVIDWLKEQSLPFVSSWSGMSYFSHENELYCGSIGVYGNRGANYILQNCDALLVLGSRLDTRQRSGRPKDFAPAAKVLVVDIDGEELKKYRGDGYGVCQVNLAAMPQILSGLADAPALPSEWTRYVAAMKSTYFGKYIPSRSAAASEMSPYSVVQRVNGMIRRDAVVIADCGANLCWVYQIFKRTEQILYTAAGNSPMGYSLPAAIGAALEVPERQIISFIGDGGLQINIQELQTVVHYRLPIKLVILNNRGYGIIKQFQDSYFGGRYEASGRGYSVPDFGKIARAYGLCYQEITALDQLRQPVFEGNEPYIIDVKLNEHAEILPKLEMGRPINDQFPYVSDEEFERGNAFVPFARRRTQ
jgi:acetolactate synthase-1/2/3 large subunit